jgi:small-conductance mechanosensitive channel
MVNVLFTAINQLVVDLVSLVPRIFVAILIWIVGRYLINLAVRLVRKIDIRGLNIDDKLIGIFSSIVLVVGKILLVLIILDYLGVGQTIVGAIAGGLTFTVALALGLAFGKAFEEDAKRLVDAAKRNLGNNKK